MIAPKLRFSEFKDEWQISKLKDVCKINQGLQIAISERFLENGENRYFYITNEFLKEGSKKNYFIENPPKSVICNETDILMTRTGNTGQVVTDVDGAFHNNFFKIDYSREVINKGFFVEFLRKESTQNLILKYAGASTIPDLNHSDFYKIEMIYPNLKEQTKIAEFLSAVDDKISQLSRQLELLNQYKKGAMQKIFSQEIRFKNDNGEDFGEWDKLKVKDLYSFYSTNSFSRADLSKVGKIANIHYGDIHTKYKSLFKANEEDLTFLNESINIDKFSSEQFLKVGDLILADASEDYNDIGKAIEIINLDNKQFLAGLHTLLARPKQKLALGFSAFLFQSNSVRKQIKVLANGISVLGISKSNLSEVNIELPTIQEQEKIAGFLTAIDERIDHTTAQLTHTKQWKKGLLQQMFV